METKLPYGMRTAEGYPINLDLQFRTGNRMALSYSYLATINYNPSDGILLNFPSAKIMIQGRNLGKLYEGFIFHRVEWIREETLADQGESNDNTQPVITEIELMGTE